MTDVRKPRVGDVFETTSGSARPRGGLRTGTVTALFSDGSAQVYWQPPYRTTVCSAKTLAKYRLVKEGPARSGASEKRRKDDE